MSLVLVDELKDYMSGVTFTAAQLRTAQSVIDGVQRQLERYCNRVLEPVLIQERVQADGQGRLKFSKTPVIKLISIIDQFGSLIPIAEDENGAQPTVPPLDPTEYENYSSLGVTRQVDNVGSTFYGSSVIGYGGFGDYFYGPLLVPEMWYVLKYIAAPGDLDLDDVRLSILRVSAREMTRHHDDTMSTKDGIISDDSNPEIVGIQGFGFTPDELTQFDRLRRRVIV
jgi:hypothetical protein